jgi:hypothetical protein
MRELTGALEATLMRLAQDYLLVSSLCIIYTIRDLKSTGMVENDEGGTPAPFG